MFQDSPVQNKKFAHDISFVNPMVSNKYFICLRNSLHLDTIKDTMRNQILKDESFKSNMEIMKNDLRLRDLELVDIIRPYIEDRQMVWKLVDHFFNSELYLYYSFINTETFRANLRKFYLNPLTTTPPRSEYILMGTLLIIMRISYISYYNLSDSHDDEPVIGPEASTMANICIDKGLFPLHHTSEGDLQLLLLVLIYQRSSPELNTILFAEKITSFGVLSAFNEFGIHLDSKDDSDSQYKRRLWYSLLEVDSLEFSYLGTPAQIKFESFTTQLPNIVGNGSEDDLINHKFHESHKTYRLVLELSKMPANVKRPPDMDEYAKIVLEIKRQNVTLDEILVLDSSTKMNRWNKSIKFLNFLDLSILEYMVSSILYIFYDNEGTNPVKIRQFLEWALEAVNRSIKLTYFLDPLKYPNYNLQKHFGYSAQFFPRMIQLLHRVGQFQQSLYLKLSYQQQKNPNSFDQPYIDKILKTASNNNRLIAERDKILGKRYKYAKKFSLLFSFLNSQLHDNNNKLNPIYIDALSKQGPVFEMDNDTLKYVALNLLELEASFESAITFNQYEDLCGEYFGQISEYIDSYSIPMDNYIIEQLESFLNGETFTSN